jgi:hypothetical protein
MFPPKKKSIKGEEVIRCDAYYRSTATKKEALKTCYK